MLTQRQQIILTRLVKEYLADGEPVGSKALARNVEWGPSTIRYELAMLEQEGLLAHPHTSAGRVPTDAGYRYFVDTLLSDDPRSAPTVAAPAAPLSLSLVRHEVDEAMRQTTATLSQMTNLPALVSAPPIETATVRHIEVLLLQPDVLMVVVITSSGDVTKRVFTFGAPVDPGLADWGASYLNVPLAGVGLGALKLRQRLADPTLGPRERGFLDAIAPVFTDLAGGEEHTLYIDGAARLVGELRLRQPTELDEVMQMLERRVALLGVLRAALAERGVYVRIGRENEMPALHSLALVASSYGLPAQSLGTVSVIGPLRMDYDHAIRSVRAAALELSRFAEDLYEA